MESNVRLLGNRARARSRSAADNKTSADGSGHDEPGEVNEKPRSVYEIVTRRMLEDLREDVAEVKGRVNALLWLMAGAILAEFVLRVVR
jgi:hypothetical protein